MRLDLTGGAYKGRSNDASPEEAINLFTEPGPNDSFPSLVNVPGCIEFAQLPVGEVRGMERMGDYVYAVCGSKLYRVDSAGAYTELGTLSTSTGAVSMCNNGATVGGQVCIADGGPLKVYDITTGLLTTTTTENTSSVDYVDDYVVFVADGSQKYYWTAINDATSVDPLSFASAKGESDNLVSVFADRKRLWLLGEDTSEVHYNSGGSQPFSTFQGGFMHVGCAAPLSVARIGNGIAWLSRNELGNAVPMIAGDYNPKPLTEAHPQVAYQMAQYPVVSDAFAYSYTDEGHDFYVLTFPSGNATWVFDVTSKEWHQRAHIINDRFPNRERYNCHCFSFEKHLVGDYANGKIYELNSIYHTMNGEIIPNQRTTKGFMDKEEDRVRIRSVQLSGEEGLGGDVSLAYSKDGGHTWSQEINTSFGEIGKYGHRAIWRKLGHGRRWVFRFIRRADARTVYIGAIAKEYGDE